MEFNGTFLASIISFILFVLIMNKVLYKPVLSVMENRRNLISGNYQDAENNDKKASSLTSEREEKLLGAKKDARLKYNSELEKYKNQKNDIVSQAQSTAKSDIEQSNADLAQLSNEVKEGLKSSMNELAGDIVEKILGYKSEVDTFDEDEINKLLYS